MGVHCKSLSTFLYMLEYFQNKYWGYQGLRGERNGKLLFNRYKVSVWYDENFLKIDHGNGCTFECF